MLQPNVSVAKAFGEVMINIQGMAHTMLEMQEKIKKLEEEIKRLKPDSTVDTVGNLIIEKEDK